VRALLFPSILLFAACAAPSNEARLSVPHDGGPGSSIEQPLLRPGDQADGLPGEAFELLAESAADSCAICARDLRRRAFRILEERFRPGTVLRSDPRVRFAMSPRSTNELMLTSHLGGDPALTFRFPTEKDHLVGISESDWTEGSLAGLCRTAPDGAEFQGAIEIVPFAYGDGPTFSCAPSSNRIQVHCRLLEIAGF
jgi:hypothetical protein